MEVLPNPSRQSQDFKPNAVIIPSPSLIHPENPRSFATSLPPTIQKPPRAIIFDLGDVLFQWSAKTTTTISARSLRAILSTPIWNSYERGEITRDACFERSAQRFSLSASEIAEAFVQARASLEPDLNVVAFLRELKTDPSIQVYAMSNIGKEDYEDVVTARPEGDLMWLPGLFDRVFTSAAAGTRKPERAFYHHVLEQIGLAGNQVTFIDDKVENTRSARGLGIHGIVFQDGQSTVQTLRNLLDSPVGKGWRYLYQNAKDCVSITDSGVSFADNFAKLLIAEVLHDRSLIDLTWDSRETWNFFADGETPALVPGGSFPDDLDTTSLALQTIPPSNPKLISSILEKMAQHVNDDGTFQTYFNHRHRIDPIVTANILTCFYAHSLGHLFPATANFIHATLLNRSYLPHGTRYYSSPDECLFFISRLLKAAKDDDQVQGLLGPLLVSRVRERLGMVGGSALDLASRMIACELVEIPAWEYEGERRGLLDMQCEDGSWEVGWMYRYGSTGVRIGNRAVTTALAVRALRGEVEG